MNSETPPTESRVSSRTPSTETPYFEAAHWFIRIEKGPLSEPEWARFGNWFNFSRWNRLAFRQVRRVWHGAPGPAESEAPVAPGPTIRFAWHHTDAWRDAVLPMALRRYFNGDEYSGAGQREFMPVQAAAAPAGLL